MGDARRWRAAVLSRSMGALTIGCLPVLAAVLTACAQQVSGAPSAAQPGPEERERSAQERITAPPDVLASGGRPGPGQCVDSKRFAFAECSQPHDIEITEAAQLPPGMAAYPDEQGMLRAALPPCRAALHDYLGSEDSDATRLQAWAFWPNRERWDTGDRWLLCAATELGPDGRPVSRTGSLHGALGGDGFTAFQLCTAGSPSREQQLRTVGCDQPHLGEALPGVLVLGRPSDPVPPADQMNTAAREHCGRALAAYLGAPGREDVFPAWRMPGPQDWAQGYTGVTCYAETTRPVARRVRGVGTGQLPG